MKTETVDVPIWKEYIKTAIEEISLGRKSFLDVRWDLKQPENCLDQKERRNIMLKIAAGVDSIK